MTAEGPSRPGRRLGFLETCPLASKGNLVLPILPPPLPAPMLTEQVNAPGGHVTGLSEAPEARPSGSSGSLFCFYSLVRAFPSLRFLDPEFLHTKKQLGHGNRVGS